MATATGKSYYGRPSYRFLTSELSQGVSSSPFELDESDFYNTDNSAEFTHRKPAITVSGSRIGNKNQMKRGDPARGTPASLPVNIPDWSKILKEEYRDSRRRAADSDDDDEDAYGLGGDEESVRVPPHEFLARTRIVSFSVHEGVGRTLKGGDLTRVRNAIWEKTGFQD